MSLNVNALIDKGWEYNQDGVLVPPPGDVRREWNIGVVKIVEIDGEEIQLPEWMRNASNWY